MGRQVSNVVILHDGRSSMFARRVRLFSAASLKPLGTLSYHRETVHVLAFGNLPSGASPGQEYDRAASTIELGASTIGDDDEDEEDDEDGTAGSLSGITTRDRWLVSGSKDRRMALWGLKDFSKS